jgi:hypothetical protein
MEGVGDGKAWVEWAILGHVSDPPENQRRLSLGRPAQSLDRTRVRRQKAGRKLEERGLAGAVRAD